MRSRGPKAQESRNKSPNNYKCTACDKIIKTSLDAYLHPLIGCLICRKCNTTYGTGDFAKNWSDGVDEQGDDNYCRWCCDGGDLFGCAKGEDTGERCHYSFCKDCIQKHIPDDPILTHDDLPEHEKSLMKWFCYACDSTKLSKLRHEAEAAIQDLNKTEFKRDSSKTESKKELDKAEPKKTEQKKMEVDKAEPKKAEHKKMEVDKAELKKAEPKKMEVDKAEPKKVEPKKMELKRTDLDKSESKKAELKRTDLDRSESRKTELEKSEPNKAELDKTESNKIETKRTEPKRIEPKRTEPKRTEPKRTEPKKDLTRPEFRKSPPIQKTLKTKTQNHNAIRKMGYPSPNKLKTRIEFYRKTNDNCVEEIKTKFDIIFEMLTSEELFKNPKRNQLIDIEIESLQRPRMEFENILQDLKKLGESPL